MRCGVFEEIGLLRILAMVQSIAGLHYSEGGGGALAAFVDDDSFAAESGTAVTVQRLAPGRHTLMTELLLQDRKLDRPCQSENSNLLEESWTNGLLALKHSRTQRSRHVPCFKQTHTTYYI
eukprot:6306244-Amphidinium_carterae.1